MKFGKTRWQTINGIVCGASHIRNNKPCQDAVKTVACEQGTYHIISLADGHGSDRCPHSDEGAQAAVDTACAVFAGMFDGRSVDDAAKAITDNKDIWLPKQIEQRWKAAVRDIHTQKEREPACECEPFPYEMYGATLISLVVAGDFVFAMQLGDGDILTISAAPAKKPAKASSSQGASDAASPGQPHVAWVFPPDDTHIGVDTDSLCLEDCWKHFKAGVISPCPDMLLLATDGYSNSFALSEGFLKAGADIYEILKEQGAEYVENELEGWLARSSEHGSGDDIAMGLVFRF